MNAKYFQTLELEKIVAMALERAVCAESKERLKAELPFTRADDVRHLLSQTDTLASHLLKNGNPRISSCPGADTAVRRAVKGGILSMGELLSVSGALRNFSLLTSWFTKDEGISTPTDDLFLFYYTTAYTRA